jgi:WD40 repeat protein
VLVLGEFGTGKTFLLHELARRMAEEGSGPVPILLQMRALEKGRSLDALLAQHFALEEVDDFNPRKFRYMLEQGRVALLFDGFDELALRVTYPKATEHFDTILQAAGGNAKVILTSRRQHFLSEAQVKNALGERVDLIPGNRIALLRPFDREQIRRFLVGFCGDEAQAEARLKLIESVNDLMGLSHNPRMLGFIAELPEENLLAARQGNREITAAELYRLILTRWLEGEVDRVQPKGARPGLSIEDRWKAVTALARRLWQKTDSFISLAELEEDTARVLESLGAASLEPDVAAFQVASGTLLVRDEEERFAFLHQSILEWLVAREAAAEIEAGGAPEALSSRDLSPLMADFLIDLCDPERLKVWLLETGGARSDERTRNVLLVAQRMERSRSTPAGEAGGSIEILSHGLRGVDLSGQDLSGADFSEADFTDAVLIETLLIGASLRKAQLAGAKLNRADLTNADLSRADLTEADLTGARLIGADLRGARLEGALLHRARLLGARWDRSATRSLRAAADAGAAVRDLDGFRAVVSFPDLYGSELAWSPDGGLLAAAQRLSVRLWDASTGQEGPRIGRHRGTIHSLAFSPCGRYLATGSEDGTAVLWNLADGEEFQRFELQSAVRSLSFNPAGNWLACGLDSGRVVLWTVPGGRQLRQLAGNAGEILRLAFAQDGKALVAATEKGALITWSMPSGQEMSRASGQGEFNRFMDQSCSPDGRLLAIGGSRGTVVVQDTADETQVRRLEGHEGAVRAVCFDPAGRRLASGGDDSTVRLWDLAKNRELLRMEDEARVSGLSFSPDGRTLAIRSGERIRLREASTGRWLHSFRNLGRRLRDVNFSPGGRSLVSASRDGFVSVWNLGTGRETLRLGEFWSPRSVAFSREGDRILGGSSEGTLWVWDAATGRVLQRLESDTPIRDAGFSPDGWRIVSGGDEGAVTIWKVTSGKILRSLTAGSASIQSVVFSPDGRRVAAGSFDGTIYLWGTGRQPRSLRTGVSPVSSVTFNSEGGLIACGSWGQQVQVWDLATERIVSHFGGHLGRVRSVRFSPEGQVLASCSDDGTVRLWKLSTGRELRVFEGHDAAVRSVSFSPDGRLLASASEDGTLRLWKVASGDCLAILAPLAEGWVAFAPDGRYKLGGVPGGAFWHVVNLCRFEPGELDDLIPGLRLADNASFLDLPPWKAELRKEMAERPGAAGGDAQG